MKTLLDELARLEGKYGQGTDAIELLGGAGIKVKKEYPLSINVENDVNSVSCKLVVKEYELEDTKLVVYTVSIPDSFFFRPNHERCDGGLGEWGYNIEGVFRSEIMDELSILKDAKEKIQDVIDAINENERQEEWNE